MVVKKWYCNGNIYFEGKDCFFVFEFIFCYGVISIFIEVVKFFDLFF